MPEKRPFYRVARSLLLWHFSKPFHWISRPRKPMSRHQNHDSSSIMSKAMITTAKCGWKCPKIDQKAQKWLFSKMLLPTPEGVLHAKFEIPRSKTVTCSLGTDNRQTDNRQQLAGGHYRNSYERKTGLGGGRCHFYYQHHFVL